MIEKLNSDHSPTQIVIELETNPYGAATVPGIRELRYSVLDLNKFRENIQTGINALNRISPVTLNDINELVRNSTAIKQIKHSPIKFWTPQLKKAVRLQNRHRKRIAEARRKNLDPFVHYIS